jgi:excisionase family DNA binding protein
MPEWLTVNEAAAYLKISRSTLYLWCQQGIVRFHVTASGRRRFLRENLDELMKEATSAGKGKEDGRAASRRPGDQR